MAGSKLSSDQTLYGALNFEFCHACLHSLGGKCASNTNVQIFQCHYEKENTPLHSQVQLNHNYLLRQFDYLNTLLCIHRLLFPVHVKSLDLMTSTVYCVG